MIKKIFIGLGSLVGVLILAIVLIPFFFDANKLKPQIQKAVEDHLNADFSVGDLKLSLWGGVYIKISKISLSEKGGSGKNVIFSVNDAKLEIPFISLLNKKLDIILDFKAPEINIVKGADDKFNFSKIMKASSPGQTGSTQGSAASVGAVGLDLSFRVTDGRLTFADEKKRTRTNLTGLDLDLRHFQLGQVFEFNFKTNLDSKEMKDLVLKGPISLGGSAAIYMKPGGGGLDRMDLQVESDLTKLTVRFGQIFNKSENVALGFGGEILVTDKNLKLSKFKITANDALILINGTVDNFSEPVLNLEVSSNRFVFENWQSILEPLKNFDMKGAAAFNIKTEGALSKLGFHGKLSLLEASLKAPGIVPRVSDLKAEVNFTNDTATLVSGSLKMGASDLQMGGTIRSFSRPQVVLNLKSQNFDIDSLLPESPTTAKTGGKTKEEPMTDAQMQAAMEGPITAMKKNPIMRELDFSAHGDFKKITMHKAQILNLQSDIGFKNLVMTLKKASAQAFGGNMQMAAAIDFRAAEPSYQVSGDVNGLDLNAAVTSQMPMAKDTLFGKAVSKFSLSGSGLNKTKVKQTLVGTGHIEIKNGSLSSLTAMKEIGAKAGGLPIPGIKEKIGSIQVTDKFRQLKADLKIGGGKINITNMVADMEGANTTVYGQGWVDFDLNNSIAGRIVAPAGGDVPQDIRAADGRMTIPYEIGCLVTAPCFKADPTLQALGKAYAKSEGAKALKKAVEKIDNQQVKDLLKKLPF